MPKIILDQWIGKPVVPWDNERLISIVREALPHYAKREIETPWEEFSPQNEARLLAVCHDILSGQGFESDLGTLAPARELIPGP